jgi:hypothetical protein
VEKEASASLEGEGADNLMNVTYFLPSHCKNSVVVLLGAVLAGLWTPFLAHTTPPPIPPLDQVVRACEERHEMCTSIIGHNVPDEQIVKYLKIGCTARDMPACYVLGMHYLWNGNLNEAWFPLAKACFVNHNVACHELRDRDMPQPPVMSVRARYGPSWPSDFSPLDTPIVEHQREFEKCYNLRRGTKGLLRLRIRIEERRAKTEVLDSSLNNDLANCMVREIESITFPDVPSTSFERTFEYYSIYTTPLRH